MCRKCAGCGLRLASRSFSHNQWLKGSGKSKCKNCVRDEMKTREISQPKKERKTSTLPDRSDVAELGSSRARVCIVCDQVKGSFSHNQWLKGEGKSKCKDCVTKESNMKEERGTSFGGFFSEGIIGCQLFQMDGGSHVNIRRKRAGIL